MLYLILSALIIFIDRISKAWVDNNFILGQSQTIISPFVDFTYVQNNGAAYSILQGKQTLLIVFTLLVMIGILAYLIVYRKKISKLEQLSLSLILGGGIGNLIDRIILGYVIDFVNIHIIPVFNVADIGITIGCILFAITILFLDKNNERRKD